MTVEVGLFWPILGLFPLKKQVLQKNCASLDARLYRVYLLHLLCSGNTVPGTEFRELNFLLVVPWKVFPEQIIVEVLGPQRAYRPEISRQGCLQGRGCGGRRQYYCFRFTMNHVIHPIETPPCLLAGEGGVCFLKVQSLLLNSGSKSNIGMAYNR